MIDEPNDLPPDVERVVRDAAHRARVEKLLEKEEKKPPPFLERWADSSIGKFVLTGIVGAALTVGFQMLGDHFKRDAERREARRSEALVLVDSLVGLLNDGSYIISRVYDAATWDPKTDSAKYVDTAFAAFNQRFERREASYAARVCALTDSALTTQFWNVADAIHYANPTVRGYRNHDGTIEQAMANAAVSKVRNGVFQFAADLARHVAAPESEEAHFGRKCPVPQRM